jgi:hypothetical protein
VIEMFNTKGGKKKEDNVDLLFDLIKIKLNNMR